MNEIQTLIKYIEESEEQELINNIKKYKELLDAHGVAFVKEWINPKYNCREHTLFDANNNIIKNIDCRNYVYYIGSAYDSLSYIYDITDYLKNLNVIYFEHLSPFGIYCDASTLYVDKNKLDKFDQNKKNIIVAFYALLPLINIYSIGAKGYNGVKGNYEKCSLTLLLKHIGLSDEKILYSISKRHEQGTINGIEFILPPNHLKLYSLTNFLNNKSPFFEITEKIDLYTNSNKSILHITHKALRINQGSSVHHEKATFVTFVDNNNKIIDRKDQDVKDYIMSEKILDALMS